MSESNLMELISALHTYYEKRKGRIRVGKEILGAHLPRVEAQLSVEALLHISTNQS